MSVDGDSYQFVECCDVLAFEPHQCVECKSYVCNDHSTTPDENDPDLRVCTDTCLDEWNSRLDEQDSQRQIERQAERYFYGNNV